MTARGYALRATSDGGMQASEQPTLTLTSRSAGKDITHAPSTVVCQWLPFIQVPLSLLLRGVRFCRPGRPTTMTCGQAAM